MTEYRIIFFVFDMDLITAQKEGKYSVSMWLVQHF